MQIVKALLLILVTVCATIITIQNTEMLTVRLLLWNVEMSRIALILLSMLIGFILGILVVTPFRRRRPAPPPPEPPVPSLGA